MEYTYECKKCGEFTVEQSMKDEPLKKCPKCGQDVNKVFRPTLSIWKCDGAFGKAKS